jgi:hypothetical protein
MVLWRVGSGRVVAWLLNTHLKRIRIIKREMERYREEQKLAYISSG